MTFVFLLLTAPSVSAAPGVPAAPTIAFQENFENGTGNTTLPLTKYVGAGGETYTADGPWLVACNGEIVNYNTPVGELGNCANTNWTGNTRQLAYALGVQNGTADPATNHAVTAYTGNNPGPNRVEFKTVNPIPLAASGRYLTFSVNAAAVNCFATAPLYQFYLTNAGAEIPVGGQLNACTSGKTAGAPASGPVAAKAVNIGTYTSNGSVLFTGSSLGVLMRNANGSGTGNDAAFDDITVLDVTPTLDKDFAPAMQYVGRPSTLTFTITNTTELSAKEGWSFTDNLPAGLLVANPANASTTCPGSQVTASAGGTSVVVKGDLKAGEASCTVKVDVTASQAGTVSNCPANVTLFGLNPPQCSSLTFLAPDIVIDKTMTPSPLVPGEHGTYHLKVTNNGPGPAEGIVVSDPLPNGVALASADPGCSAGAGTVSCELASLAPGASQTFDLGVKVASSLRSCPANTASVTSATPDPEPANNTAQVCPATERRVDLSIEKIASSAVVIPGGQVMYTLVVQNNGPSDASEVTVVDPGAPGLSLIAAKPSQGSCSVTAGRLTCELGELAANATAQLLLTANAVAKSGPVSNTATLSTAEKETDPANNQASATIRVEPPPAPEVQPPVTPRQEPQFDLRLRKTAAHKRIAADGTARYMVAVTNEGPEAAPNVTVVDTFNRRAALRSVKTTAGRCSQALPLRCSLGTLPVGTTVRITVVLLPLESGCGERNAASALGEGKEASPPNNLSSVDLCVSPQLRVVKTADRESVEAGGSIHYSIRVTNRSRKVVARDVRTCDNLPMGLSLLKARAKPKATLSKGRPCWTARLIRPGKTVVYRLTAKALRGAKGTKRNVATAQGPGSKAVKGTAAVRVRAQQKPKSTPVTG